MLVTPELVSPLDKNEVTEAPGDRVYPAQRRRVLLPRPDRGKAGPRVPRHQGRARPAQPDEALPERAAVGHRPARPLRLISESRSDSDPLGREAEHGRSKECGSAGGPVAAILAALVADGARPSRRLRRGDSPARRSATAAGTLHRMFHHSAHTPQDKFVGYPDTFIEPPLGYYVNEQFAVQVAKADTHRFTLYRSRLPAGHEPVLADRSVAVQHHVHATSGLVGPDLGRMDSRPAGAGRRHAARPCSRRLTGPAGPSRPIASSSGLRPIREPWESRPSSQYSNTIFRNQAAPRTFPLPPAESASMGVR